MPRRQRSQAQPRAHLAVEEKSRQRCCVSSSGGGDSCFRGKEYLGFLESQEHRGCQSKTSVTCTGDVSPLGGWENSDAANIN